MGKAINEITIYQRNGSVRYKLNSYTQLCTIKSAEQKRELLGEDSVTLKTTSAVPMECSIGDYIIVYGSVYTLNKAGECTKNGERSFEQQYTFEGLQYKLLDAQYRNADAAGNNPTASFSIVANMQLLMQVLITNINRVATSLDEVWALGDCPTTEYKEFTYNNQNCLNVLQEACEAFETEFEIVQTSAKHYTLHIRQQGALLPATFDFSKQSGVYKLRRKNVNSADIVTRLYVEGSTKNIGNGYRNGSERLRLAGQSYVQSEQGIAAFGIKEGSRQYEDIYPHRIGKVTGIVAGNNLQFVDANMFNLNEKENGNTKYLIDGTSAKVRFTGNSSLAGYEFEVHKYNHSTHTFTLVQYEDRRGLKLPDGGAYSIAVDDEYVLLDIVMPQDPYITDAEAELQQKGADELEALSQPRVEYELEIASMSLEKEYGTDNTIVNVFQVGDLLHIKDTDINVDKAIRIKSFTRDCYADPYKYKITLGDTLDVTLVERLIEDNILQNEVIALNDLTNLAKARTNWRSTQELLHMVFDSDGYFDPTNIKPSSIETMMLSVGNRAGQFVLRNIVIEANAIVSGVPQPNQLKVTSNSGVLIHYAIEEQDRTWQLQNLSITLSNNNAYYVYAKCAKGSNAAEIIASQDKLAVDDGNSNGYYYFLIGVLSSVYQGYRDLTLTYGATRITGRTINCGKIESVDGETYFDLDNSEIGGNIKFKSTGGTLMGVEELEQLVSTNTELIGQLQDTAEELQQQIDGAIEYWFGTEVPTLNNAPAEDWEDKATRDLHIGDIYTDTTTGLEYRFSRTSRQRMGVTEWIFFWQETASTGIGQAIQTANNALNLAGSKNHVYITSTFTNASVTNYEEGDLWLALDTLKMRVCKSTASAQDTYNPNDWGDIGYTDDTAANAAQAVLDNMANDSKITPAEKIQLKTEMLNITADYTAIHTKANSMGITHTALVTAYTNLYNYVSNILSNMSTTSSITRTTYNNYFSAYYTQRAAVMAQISGKQASDAVDALEIGQGNYIGNGAFFENTNGWGIQADSQQLYQDSVMGSVMRFGKSNTEHFFFLHTSFKSSGGNLLLPDNTFRAGVKYTLAFWVKANHAIQLRVGIMEPAGQLPVANYWQFDVGTEWKRIVYTFVATDKSQSDTQLYIRGEYSTTFEYLMFTKFVLVEGNKAPEWTDSSREFLAQQEANTQTLEAITNNYTQIDGGLILSTFLKLGAILANGVYQESAGVKAMLENINEVAAYFGGTLAEAIAGTKQGMCIVYHNGKFKALNAEITGKIVASSGSIGGLAIGDGWIGAEASTESGNTDSVSISPSLLCITGRGKWIGMGKTLPSTTNDTCVMRVENNQSNSYYTNHGLMINVSGGQKNFAVSANAPIKTSKWVKGYAFRSVTPSVNSCVVVSETWADNPWLIIAKYIYSNSGIGLPKRETVASLLNIGTSTAFAVKITIIGHTDSTQNGYIVGRNTAIDGMNTASYPYIRNNNGGWEQSKIGHGKGDVDEFMLVYDGSSYNAYWINHRN